MTTTHLRTSLRVSLLQRPVALILAALFLLSFSLRAQDATNAAPATTPGDNAGAAAISSVVSPRSADAPAPAPSSTPTPAPPPILVQQGYAAIKASHYGEAINDLTQAIQLDPGNGSAFRLRAYAYRALGARDQAISDYNQAIQINPKDALAYSQRAFTYRMEGNEPQALADFTKSIQLSPTNAFAFNHRANIYNRQGQYEKALDDYIQALQINPAYEGAYNALAWLLATCPNPDFRNGKKAVEYASKACDLSQWKKPSMIDTLAAACAEAGDFDAAIKWENQFLAMPNVEGMRATNGQSRLALYQAHQPYHAANAAAASLPEPLGTAVP